MGRRLQCRMNLLKIDATAKPFLSNAVWGAIFASVLSLAGCSAPPTIAEPLRFSQPLILLGEVHDNAAQHALRLRAFEALLAGGARPTLALEQFDREYQPAIDRALTQTPLPDADALIAIAGGAVDGWQWEFYRPYIALALRYRLPISAANVSRTELRGVMRDGLAASGFDPQVPEPLLQMLAQSIEASHCGVLDNATARRMALAQVARDQFMARVVERHADRGVLLLAGNGHVRTDVGVPRWLSAATRARSEAVGVLEAGDPTAAFDRLVFTPAQPRPDPCEAFRAAAKP
jgi:uncharacterized iron-regulated protein